MKSLAMVSVLALCVSTAVADLGMPWLPDWTTETGYTSQYWGLHAVGEQEPAQPLAADNYIDNGFGTPTAVWDSYDVQGEPHYYGWLAQAIGTHPGWVDEVWGGMVTMGDAPGSIDMNATVPTGGDSGSLIVFVQYDWYEYSCSVTASVTGATDVTPAGYYDYTLGWSGSGKPWHRTTQVFEFGSNPGSIDVIITAAELGIPGPPPAPMVDSFSVTTAVGATIPQDMPTPEPGTVALLVLGGLLTLGRRARAS